MESMKVKKIHLELLRIIAIFFVIYVHTGTDGAELYTLVSSPLSYWSSLFLAVLAQISIPVFFLISGAVLLQKEESLKEVLSKRVFKIIIVILVFGLVQYGYSFYLKPEVGFSISVFLKLVYSTTVITQYWYLYSYLAFLLILPFVRMLAKSMQAIHYWYLFGLFFLMEGLLPIFEYVWSNTRIILSIPLFFSSIMYPLIGYYVEHKSEQIFFQKKNLLIVNGFAMMALATNLVVARMAHLQRGAVETLSGMTLLLSIVLFINIRYFCHKFVLPQTLTKLISFLGSGVFMVYLLEPQLRDSFRVIYLALSPTIGWFLSCILWIASAILCGCFIMYIFKKIPIIKKLF